MSDHIYKLVELVGSSAVSIEDAIQTAISRASSTIDNVRWFEVTEPSGSLPMVLRTTGTFQLASARGHVENGKVTHLPVTVKVGFTLRP